METENIEENHVQASKIITKYLGWSAGAAFIPVPGFDLAAVTAVQIKMIADIAKVYGVPFKKDATKKEVKEAIELMFKVEVTAVNILNMNGKTKRAGRLMGKRNDWKKAYISLKAGQEINFTGE